MALAPASYLGRRGKLQIMDSRGAFIVMRGIGLSVTRIAIRLEAREAGQEISMQEPKSRPMKYNTLAKRTYAGDAAPL
jgi:hypothetical protein